MKFLVDRCAGRRLADWLRSQGHDVLEARERGPDPGDSLLLEWAADESRVLVTIDADFGRLIFRDRQRHCGIVRLPAVPAAARIAVMRDVLEKHHQQIDAGAIVTARHGLFRVSKPPDRPITESD
jgi:predicted nuclease of predicted toxin-antitoxin system